ncbi:MAG: trehalose-phosphatase [Deltaproteobacteria bacterium]|nr:trehalose-phosphatase [Deltaproteobacteria bacterium]
MFLAIDYDGTLVPFAVDRMSTLLAPAVRSSLDRLTADPACLVAIVSGRQLKDLEYFLGGLKADLIGAHGQQWRRRDGAVLDTSDTSELDRQLQEIAAKLQRALPALDGQRFERKPGCLALHLRALDSDEAAHVERAVHTLCRAGLPPRLTMHPFNGGFEFRNAAVDKGQAVARWLDSHNISRASSRVGVFYLGDDRTDEDAFIEVERRGGHGIKIGEGQTRASLRLKDHRAVHQLLEQLAQKAASEGGTHSDG